MKTLTITMFHHGDGNVRFIVPEIEKDHRPVLLFRDAGRTGQGAADVLQRLVGIDPVLGQIIRIGLKNNGCINLYGRLGNDQAAVEDKQAIWRYAFSTAVQLDCDMVCKIDRMILGNLNFSKHMHDYSRVCAMFFEELQRVLKRFRRRLFYLFSSISTAWVTYDIIYGDTISKLLQFLF